MLKMKTLILLTIVFFAALSLNAQNVMISNINNPNETSISIDPKNPNVLIVGANINNYYISIDTGYTWSKGNISSSFGVWGDPVIAVDTSSNFYYFHLSDPATGNWIDRIVCQKSSNNGTSWSDGSFAGLNGVKAQDKPWCAIDRTNNNIYITWTQFDTYGSSNPVDSSIILFSKSTDAGDSWSQPKRINSVAGDCIDSDGTVEGAVPAVGPNGEIYVSWAGPNGLVFNKSLDQGDTWLSNEIVIDSFPRGWNISVPGIYRANGFPVTCCDLSNGHNRGTIYINWSDQRNGTKNTDIWLVKSTDGGQKWSSPIRVNDDNTNRHQFFNWMAIDQTNGYLYFIFYDRRNHSDNFTDVYMALSIDGGNTFINRKISETPFLPNEWAFFGDYTNVAAHNGVIRPVWTRLNDGELSIWTNITRLSDFGLSNGIESTNYNESVDFQNYPNPTTDIEYVSFKLRGMSKINLSLYDINGEIVKDIIKDEIRQYGTYIEQVSLEKLRISHGAYFLRLEINGQIKVNRLIKY